MNSAFGFKHCDVPDEGHGDDDKGRISAAPLRRAPKPLAASLIPETRLGTA